MVLYSFECECSAGVPVDVKDCSQTTYRFWVKVVFAKVSKVFEYSCEFLFAVRSKLKSKPSIHKSLVINVFTIVFTTEMTL